MKLIVMEMYYIISIVCDMTAEIHQRSNTILRNHEANQMRHVLINSRINKIRDLNSSIIKNHDYIDKEDLDNNFTSATEDNFSKQITLSAFSRPNDY
jgi:hypothetical protein